MSKYGSRILAQDQLISNDTWATGINNNDLIIGPSGAGKTRNYVKPNLLQCEHSLIIADTKGSLLQEVGPVMAAHGFRVIDLDFTDLLNNTWGYNPLDYIRHDAARDKYSEQDILTVAACLIPVEDTDEPFWEQSAQLYAAALIGYVLEALPEEEHDLGSVCRLYQVMTDPGFDKLFQALQAENPKSYACQTYRMVAGNREADKTHASIKMFLVKALSPLSFDGPVHLYHQKNRIDFKALGREKTALFLTISDTDRSMDKLASLFYTQALHALCESADKDYPDHRLPVPVRFILDDFATNVVIPDFDKIISVIRSREIYVSLIIQSITQLYGLYGEHRGKTIINNCDNCLYLGGQDVDTADFISVKTNKPRGKVLDMPLGDVWLFTRGQQAKQVRKYDLTRHPLYPELPEAGGGAVLPEPSVEAAPQPAVESVPAAAPSPAPPERELGPWEVWMDGTEGPETEEPGMDLSAFCQLQQRRRQLAEKTARLETLLSGRDAAIAPETSDGQGRYSESRTWELVDRLVDAAKRAIRLGGPDTLRLSRGDLACLRAFLYCAVRLSAASPEELGSAGLTGTFDDLLRMAKRMDYVEKDELHFYELYMPELMDGFFGWMDEAYQQLTGTDVTDRIGEADRLVVRDIYWDVISDMEDMALEHAEPYEPDLMLNQVDEASEEELEPWTWADAFPEKRQFCQCYLFLRDQYFEGALRGALPELVEHMLDVFLAGQAGLPFLRDEAFFQALGLLEAIEGELAPQ